MTKNATDTLKPDSKKQRERRQVERFLEARQFVHSSVEPESEPDGWPDQWIRIEGAADIAVEVTEYRPRVKVGKKTNRSTIQALWNKSLWPKIDQSRRKSDELVNIQACLYFKSRDLAPQREHLDIAAELVRYASSQAADRIGSDDAEFRFYRRADLDRLSLLRGVAQEDWPELKGRIARIVLRRFDGLAWPPWSCPGVNSSFISPSAQEFGTKLKEKALQAGGHNPAAHPLWLLIVSNVPGDISSHIFPDYDYDTELLKKAVTECGFDFARSPFAEVWLTSDESGSGIRLDQM